MASTKEIKARLRSIKNLEKITKAMEMISTVKVRKAQTATIATRPLARTVAALLRSVLSSGEEEIVSHPWFVKKTEGHGAHHRYLCVLFASSKGLCGGYNISVIKQILAFRKAHPHAIIDYVTFGKKAVDFVVRTGGNLVFDATPLVGESLDFGAVQKISRTIASLYNAQEMYFGLFFVYNHFLNLMAQEAVTQQVLPFSLPEVEKILIRYGFSLSPQETQAPRIFEPSAAAVIETLLVSVLDILLYEVLCESRTSEHASRMVAMKGAKDNAKRKHDVLLLDYNKARQAAITKEVSEIVSGVESMK